MEYLSDESFRRAFWRLARQQHWVIAHWQLLDLGMHPQAIKRRLASGRLHRLWPGVYAVGRPEVSQDGRWMAAILACGAGAALGGESAAALAQMGGRALGVTEVVVPPGRRKRLRGIRTREADLAAGHVGTIRNIPLTSPVRTLIDLARVRSRDDLEAAINEADKRALIDPEALREALGEFRAVPGVAKLRRTLDRRTFVLTDTQLERCFVPIAFRVGLPKPLTQQWVNGYRVDFYWPDFGIVIETDGLTYHRTPAQQARDHVRRQTHFGAGMWPEHFTHEQVRFEPAYVEEVLRDLVERSRRSGTPRGT